MNDWRGRRAECDQVRVGRGLIEALMLAALVLLASAPATAQAPPATTGGGEPAAPQAATGNKWYEWENRAFTSTLTLSGLYDFASFVQDTNSVDQVGELPSRDEWRAERVLLGGALKFRRPWTYLLGANFNGIESDNNHFTWMDIRVDVPFGRTGRIKIGRQKVGVSQEWMMPGLDWIFMERSTMNNSFVPQRNVGIQVTSQFWDDRGAWSAGWFNDWFVSQRSLSDGANQYSARLNLILVDRDKGSTLLQFAVAEFYKQATSGAMQFRSRPEVNQSPYFIDTGSFVADHSATTQMEAMLMTGPAQIFGELSLTPVTSPESGDPFFWGGYVGASYFLTGERRSFNRRDGYYGPFRPNSPFNFRTRGSGAWEVAGRYSFTNLTSGTVDGGEIGRATASVAWYPTRNWRFEFNYGFGSLAKQGVTGGFHAFQSRLQWSM